MQRLSGCGMVCEVCETGRFEAKTRTSCKDKTVKEEYYIDQGSRKSGNFVCKNENRTESRKLLSVLNGNIYFCKKLKEIVGAK